LWPLELNFLNLCTKLMHYFDLRLRYALKTKLIMAVADSLFLLPVPVFITRLSPGTHSAVNIQDKTRQDNGEKRMQARVPLYPYPCNILN